MQNEILSYLSFAIPIVATLCNIFLFFTLLTAKKTTPVKALMLLLFSFILWTSGSAFMRMNFYPSMEVWWQVSLTGLFLVPYFYYIVVCAFFEKRGMLPKLIYGILTVVMAVMNLKNMFLTVPADSSSISYQATKWSYFPVIVASVILIHAWVILYFGSKNNGTPFRFVRPFITGVLVMALGVVLDIVPFFNALPMDTLACAVNAICLYSAFCKRRLYPVHQITSKGAMFVISLCLTAVSVSPLSNAASRFLLKNGEEKMLEINIVITLFCAALSVFLYLCLNKMNEKIFIKDKSKKEDGLKRFSKKVNITLRENEILSSFVNLMSEEVSFDRLFILTHDKENAEFRLFDGIESLEEPISISEKNPLIEYLLKNRRGVLYSDFTKSNEFRSMWEKEKQLMRQIGASYVLPFLDQETVMGIAIFSQSKNDKNFDFDEMSFMDSAAAVAAIALKNAHLYSSLEKEAQCDTLTELYNRRTFTKKLNETLANGSMNPVSLVMFNLDDFSLFNELYGTEEGDNILIRFASILSATFGSKGFLCRYGGKEFAALLPCTDAASAEAIAYRVKTQLQHQIDHESGKVKKLLTFSAGICSFPTVAANAGQLVSYANMAVFHIKQNGKNQIQIYTNDVNAEKMDKKNIIHELTSTIYALTAAVDAKDHYTFNHSRAVSSYATRLAQLAGFNEDMVEIVRQAGLLHDIGKIGIPDAILTKADRLTEEEFALMKKHPELSIEMIRHLPNLDYVIPAVIGHHERYDGKGYPRGLAGEEIPLGARILTIADSFDAMISRRSYKGKMPVDVALSEILKNLGTQFDPELGKLFAEKVAAGEVQILDY